MKIMIVDDEFVSREKMNKFIKDFGYKTLVCTNGKEALEAWKAFQPHIVVTDWLMPEVDGPELCRIIRNEDAGASIYFIMTSANTDKDDISKAKALGADDFLMKPFNKEELHACIAAGVNSIVSKAT
jgi:DNA-binding response OmpR family regulator